MMRRLVSASSCCLLIALAPARGGAQEELRVVVNAANATSSLSREEIANLFLKKVSRWPDGTLVSPVDQRENAPVRESFTREILRKSNKAVRAYWQQRIFSGRDVPPPEREGDAAVLAFVRQSPGAIGYVSPGASLSGVRVVTVRR